MRFQRQRLLRVIFTALLVAIGGCAPATAVPASEPVSAATQPSAARTLHLADAVESDTLETGDWELDLQSELPFKDQPLLFGQLATFGDDDRATATVPVIAFKDGGKLMAMKINDPRLKNAGWSYIAAGPGKNELWGVLDAALDDLQPELVIVHSTDGGQTLSMWPLPKPLPVAVFDSFCMDREGHGRVSLYVYRDTAKLRHAGYYHYRTTDGGRTWSEPEHEPDAMTPAGDAPDEPMNTAVRPSKV